MVLEEKERERDKFVGLREKKRGREIWVGLGWGFCGQPWETMNRFL